MPMDDLVQYQAPERGFFHVKCRRRTRDLGFPLAQRVTFDVATLVAAKSPTAVARASGNCARTSGPRRAAGPDLPADRHGQHVADRAGGAAPLPG